MAQLVAQFVVSHLVAVIGAQLVAVIGVAVIGAQLVVVALAAVLRTRGRWRSWRWWIRTSQIRRA